MVTYGLFLNERRSYKVFETTFVVKIWWFYGFALLLLFYNKGNFRKASIGQCFIKNCINDFRYKTLDFYILITPRIKMLHFLAEMICMHVSRSFYCPSYQFDVDQTPTSYNKNRFCRTLFLSYLLFSLWLLRDWHVYCCCFFYSSYNNYLLTFNYQNVLIARICM